MQSLLILALAFLLANCAPPRVVDKSPPKKTSDIEQEAPDSEIPQVEEVAEAEEVEEVVVESAPKSPLEGTWFADCFATGTGTSYRTTYEITGSTGKRDRTFFSDGACQSATNNIVWAFQAVQVGQKITGTREDGTSVSAYEVDQKYASTTVKILSQAFLNEVVDRADDYYFPDDDLVLNMPLDISGRVSGTVTQPAKGSVEFGVINISDGKLRFGTGWGPNAAERVTTFSNAPNEYVKIK
jgi:hypothetical protein